MTPETRTKRIHALLLALLTLACAGIGWSGARCGLPHILNADEWIYLSQYRAIAGKPLVTLASPRSSTYPDALMRGAAILPRAEADATPETTEDHLAIASADSLFLRRFVALLASLIVPATWLLARRFTSSGWSLVAAAIAGSTVLQASFAAQARPHALIAVAITFAIVAAIDVLRSGTWRAAVVSGVAFGAAMAVLQSGLAVGLAIGAAHLMRWRRDGTVVVLKRLLCVAAIAGVIVVLAYPGLLIDRVFPQEGGQRPYFLSSKLVTLDDFVGGGAPILLRAFWLHDPLLGVACAASIVAFVAAWAARRRPLADHGSELLVVLAFAVPYTVVLIAFQHTYYRFALPLFPIAALFVVLALRAAGRAGVIAAGVLVCAQLATVGQLARLRMAPDTDELAAEWIRAHADRATARIAVMPSTDLPFLRTAAAMASENNSSTGVFQLWIDYERTLDASVQDALGWSVVDLPLRRQKHRAALSADPAAYAREIEADYVVIEVFEPGARSLLAQVRAAVSTVATLVATFAPEAEGAADPHTLDPFCGAEAFQSERFTWRLFGARALGPHLEIWRISR